MNKQDREMVYRYTKISVSDKKMSNFLYAIFMTGSKLESYNHLNLERFTRKQNSGNMVSVVILIDEGKITTFEELAGVKLETSHDFQGRMKLN
jgi:hypothetical protein